MASPPKFCPKQLQREADEVLTMPRVSSGSASNGLRRFEYDDSSLEALRSTVTPDRLSTYFAHAAGDEVQAFRLYVRNAALASAFLGPLQAVEITLRNVFHNLLSQAHGSTWYDSLTLAAAQRRVVVNARRTLRQEGKAETPSRIVAECSFSFWVALSARRYDAMLWRSTLHRAFAPTPSRKAAFGQLDRLRTLRNRIAHHEPILFRNLHADYDRIARLLEMMSPETARWMRHHSRVPLTLATAAAQTTSF